MLSPIAVIRSLLRKHAHFTSSAIGMSYSHPMKRPLPLASVTCGSSESFALKYSPIICAFPLRSLSRISVMDASDAAHASGYPPYVDPCVPDVNAFATSSLAQHAPIGIPPPIAFAIVPQSGFTPYPIKAIVVLVRPDPVYTSSRRRGIPIVSQIFFKKRLWYCIWIIKCMHDIISLIFDCRNNYTCLQYPLILLLFILHLSVS